MKNGVNNWSNSNSTFDEELPSDLDQPKSGDGAWGKSSEELYDSSFLPDKGSYQYIGFPCKLSDCNEEIGRTVLKENEIRVVSFYIPNESVNYRVWLKD